MEVIASRYAESLFDLALEENKVEEYAKDMDTIYQTFQSDPTIVSFFSHVLIDDAAKFEVLDKSFKEQVNTYVCNFLKLLIKKKRIRYILDIIAAFNNLCNEHLGIEEGIIYTSYELDSTDVQKIEQAIGTKENKKVVLRIVRDETLIGGIKVQLKNQIIDASIKNKVEMLKKELLRK